MTDHPANDLHGSPCPGRFCRRPLRRQPTSSSPAHSCASRTGSARLLPPMDDRFSARRGTYRIIYRIDDENRVVTVLGVTW